MSKSGKLLERRAEALAFLDKPKFATDWLLNTYHSFPDESLKKIYETLRSERNPKSERIDFINPVLAHVLIN